VSEIYFDDITRLITRTRKNFRASRSAFPLLSSAFVALSLSPSPSSSYPTRPSSAINRRTGGALSISSRNK